MRMSLALALAFAALPALAQTTTTVTTQPQQQAAPPPPPPSSTTVTTQSQPQSSSPSTQVVVNPNDPSAAPPPRTRVAVDPEPVVETRTSSRAPVAVVATDALYGGLAGVLVGGGVTLIDQGNHWQRDLMLGTGIGILAGAAFGIYEVANQSSNTVVRAAADRNPAESNLGTALSMTTKRF